MRRNNFSSAADRRWRRRYERIQQRKEEELYRRDMVTSRDEEIPYYELLQQADSSTVAVSMPRFDGPNLNGSIISRDEYGRAMVEFSERNADPTQRSLAEALGHVAHGTTTDEDIYRIESYLQESLFKELLRASEARRAEQEVVEAYERLTRQNNPDGYHANSFVLDEFGESVHTEKSDWFDAFVRISDFKYGDRSIFSVDLADTDQTEIELDAGDTDQLDSFLGEFLCSG